VLVDDELLAEGRAVLELHEAARETEARRAHAVRYHEDEVALASGVRAVLCIAMSLIHHRENNDSRGRDDGPHEEADLAPELPGPWRGHSALCGFPGEKRIFLGDVAVAADVAGCAVRKERLGAGHGGLVVERKYTRGSQKGKGGA
jgi:hypothetical protein